MFEIIILLIYFLIHFFLFLNRIKFESFHKDYNCKNLNLNFELNYKNIFDHLLLILILRSFLFDIFDCLFYIFFFDFLNFFFFLHEFINFITYIYSINIKFFSIWTYTYFIHNEMFKCFKNINLFIFWIILQA